MSFREWLPITRRNRVALALAFAGLLMFVTWNCLPYDDYPYPRLKPMVCTELWLHVFDLKKYQSVIRSPDIKGFILVMTRASILFGGLIVVMSVPLWRLLHASKFIRIPIAWFNLFGAVVIACCFYESFNHDPGYVFATPMLMELSMLTVSTAFLLYKNELALRSERMITQIHKP
jgi:hypothetical protein